MSEYSVLKKIETITKVQYSAILVAGGLPPITSDNINIATIDPLVQPPISVWIQPERTDFGEGSISEDDAATAARVFIVMRGFADATLWEYVMKAAAYFRAMITRNDTLEGEALNATVTAFEYFDSVEGLPDARAVEVFVQVSHEEPKG